GQAAGRERLERRRLGHLGRRRLARRDDRQALREREQQRAAREHLRVRDDRRVRDPVQPRHLVIADEVEPQVHARIVTGGGDSPPARPSAPPPPPPGAGAPATTRCARSDSSARNARIASSTRLYGRSWPNTRNTNASSGTPSARRRPARSPFASA